MTYKLFYALAAMGLAASPVNARNVTADAGVIVDVLKQAGYRAEITKDNVGDPLIETGVGGYHFLIVFYGCEGGQACKTVQLNAYFETDEPISLERINAWNDENRFGSASRDADDDVALRMDIDLEDGGMSEELFVDNLEYWESVVGDLANYIY